ncbi:hypothetical protein FHP25_14695 [Vineibacter terrae]|uniref:VWA domain-containing protein n=1 Tax=Vineibacter terrae TaxID=2586908 RepID=A0A5C8PM94_9HYPH|nr:hypothetical protein [Vineibacter terrae]TXL75131.1 hypothetical protein FHP25_14695 [Vineibacter terrae]
MRRTANARPITQEAFLRERERFMRMFDDPAAPLTVYMGIIIDAATGSESMVTRMKTMPSRIARAAKGLGPITMRAVYFTGLQAITIFPSGDPGQIEFNLARMEGGGASTLPSLTGFTEALAGFEIDIPCFRPAAIILVGGRFLQDPLAAEAIALRLKDLGTRLYCFQEGNDEMTEAVFRHLAGITGGHYARIDEKVPLESLCEDAAILTMGGVARFMND